MITDQKGIPIIEIFDDDKFDIIPFYTNLEIVQTALISLDREKRSSFMDCPLLPPPYLHP